MRGFNFFIFFIFVSVILPQVSFATSYEVDIVATVPGCGDAVIQSSEECDGVNFGGSTCSSIGFSSGALSCSSVCTLITTACVLNPPNNSNTQRLPGTSTEEPVAKANLVVTGYYAPLSRVSLLKDGKLVATVFSGVSGFFQTTISGLQAGDYLLKLVGEGLGGQVVFGESFSVQIFEGLTTMISEIYLPPSSYVSVADNVAKVTGKTLPDSEVVVEFGGSTSFYTSDSEGNFLASINLGEGEGATSFRAGLRTPSGVVFGLWQKVVMQEKISLCGTEADITNDCRVNFVDLAIALWWYVYNPGSSEIDLDGNGRINLVDFSIMAYYWTG